MRTYSEEELNNLDKQTLILLLMSMQDQLSAMRASIDRLTEQIAVANQQRFGRSTEKLSAIEGQMELFDFLNEAEALHAEDKDRTEPGVEIAVASYTRKKQAGKREKDLEGLPVEVIEHDLSEDRLREVFGDKWKCLPDEVYRRLVCRPAEYLVEEHHVKVYAGTDDQTIVRADRPGDLLRNSIVTPSLAAKIMNDKYVNAVPLYRQEQELQRNGISLSRQVMAGWVIQCAERYLSVLYDWLHERLYAHHVLQADETPVVVSRDGRHAGSKSYMWVYRTGQMSTREPVILYEYRKERKADHPREFLKDFSGVVVTDGYEVYHKLGRERQDLKIAGCWSHARRRFAEAVKAAGKQGKKTYAYLILQKIGVIFDVEDQLKGLSAEERLEKRQKLVKPLVEAFFAYLKEYRSVIAEKTKTANGITYCLNQEPYLRYFLEDGEVPVDNNAAERAIRGFCIGKKNWVMIDTIEGAKASAMIYSIAETAKANHLNPYRYFEYLLQVIPDHLDDTDRTFLEEIAPWSATLPADCLSQLN